MRVGQTGRVGGSARAFAARGRAVAVIDDSTTLTHADLAVRVSARAGEYPAVETGRRIIGLVAGNTVEFLVDYLAAYEAGHAVLLLPREAPATRGLVDTWRPDVLAGDGRVVPAAAHRRPPRHELHPELALLLSTSGSTGSPKLVRLSWSSILANARSISEYLCIQPGDRAITTLPPHYCYGLSVIHSHLLVGASVVLNEDSVTSPEFWERAGAHGVTTFAAVPHTVELLERVGLDRLDHLTRLRYLTQAGGRLAPEKVRTLAERLESRDAELVVMYGQTEATARMGYLPPHLARSRAGAVGIAIPGGAFRVDRPEGTDPDAPGELVYSGPNVMMGYARDSADLARGPELSELRTGDLARIAPDGLVEIVGRMGREAKIFGHRIDLGRVEAVLADRDLDAWCVGESDRLVVVSRAEDDDESEDGSARPDLVDDRLAAAAAQASGLPASAVEVLVVDEPPRTPAGKIDQRALRELVAARDRAAGSAAASGPPGPPGALIAHALGLAPEGIDPDASFVDLGGDSLTYVVLSRRLEERVPDLPRDWHLHPVRELDELARAAVPPAARWWAPWRTWARVDTSVVLRALFILMIVGSHTRAVAIIGGAHVLVALTGYSLARFRLHSDQARERARGVLRTAGRIAVPAVLWLLIVTPLTSRYHWYSPLLATNLFGPRSWWEERWWNPWQMWFIEAVIYALLAVAALMAIPAVSRLDRRWPLMLPTAFVAAGLTVRFGLIDLGGGPQVWYSAPAVLWLFGLGWAIERGATAGTPWPRLGCSVVALLCVPGWFGDPGRELVMVAGLLALIWIPSVRLPQAVARALTPVAAASLFIYLTHFLVYPPIRDAGYVWLSFAASVTVGLVAWLVWERGARAARRSAPRAARLLRRG